MSIALQVGDHCLLKGIQKALMIIYRFKHKP